MLPFKVSELEYEYQPSPTTVTCRQEIVPLPPHTKHIWQEIEEGDSRIQASVRTSWLREMERRSSTTSRSSSSTC